MSEQFNQSFDFKKTEIPLSKLNEINLNKISSIQEQFKDNPEAQTLISKQNQEKESYILVQSAK